VEQLGGPKAPKITVFLSRSPSPLGRARRLCGAPGPRGNSFLGQEFKLGSQAVPPGWQAFSNSFSRASGGSPRGFRSQRNGRFAKVRREKNFASAVAKPRAPGGIISSAGGFFRGAKPFPSLRHRSREKKKRAGSVAGLPLFDYGLRESFLPTTHSSTTKYFFWGLLEHGPMLMSVSGLHWAQGPEEGHPHGTQAASTPGLPQLPAGNSFGRRHTHFYGSPRGPPTPQCPPPKKTTTQKTEPPTRVGQATPVARGYGLLVTTNPQCSPGGLFLKFGGPVLNI